MLDLLGHLFYIFIFIGTRLLHKKSKAGWIFRCLGDVGWAILGILLGMTSIIIWSTVFFFNDAYGWWNWYRHE